MNEFSHINIKKTLTNPDTKKQYNKQLFSIVAPKYNFVTKALSFNRDKLWKKDLIESLPDLHKPQCLDIASGTGDITFSLAKKYRDGQIIGIDLTPEMVEKAINNNIFLNTKFECQDMNQLNFTDNSFDIITGGYALRNSPDLKITLQETYRLLKPNGHAAFLDFSKPTNKILQKIEYGILKFWGSLWGILLHAKPQIYGYIAQSLKTYPDTIELQKLVFDSGFDIIKTKKYFFGISEIIILKKTLK